MQSARSHCPAKRRADDSDGDCGQRRQPCPPRPSTARGALSPCHDQICRLPLRNSSRVERPRGRPGHLRGRMAHGGWRSTGPGRVGQIVYDAIRLVLPPIRSPSVQRTVGLDGALGGMAARELITRHEPIAIRELRDERSIAEVFRTRCYERAVIGELAASNLCAHAHRLRGNGVISLLGILRSRARERNSNAPEQRHPNYQFFFSPQPRTSCRSELDNPAQS